VSNTLAIAAVTATLRNLLASGVALDPDLADTSFTMQSLDRARANTDSANQLNIFLYQAMPNQAYRNMDPPQARPGETASPVLALNLHYLLTAYGRDNDVQRPFSHQLLGRVMSIMHDHPVLGRDEIRAALLGNDVGDQFERIRFTLQPLTIDDAFRLWSGFQTQYRLSVAYEATVVLISSARPARTPLPVLARGPNDSGFHAQANLDSNTAIVTNVDAPGGLFGAEIGQTITLRGFSLAGDRVQAQFSHPRLSTPILVPAQPGGSATSFSVLLDSSIASWLAGTYALQAVITSGPGTATEVTRTSLPVRFPVAPRITDPFPLNATIANGQAPVTVNVSPAVSPGQDVSFLVGDQEVAGPDFTAATSQLNFTIAPAVAGEYLVRVRVDGADSLVVNSSATPPVFLNRKITIQ
jgi:hypothetical protein